MQTNYNKTETKAIQDYILNSIEGEEYGEVLNTSYEKLRFVLSCFKKEFNSDYEKKLNKSLVKRLAEWYSGLPTFLNIYFYHGDIIRIGTKLGLLCDQSTEEQKDTFIDNWFYLLAENTLQLCRAHKIEYIYLT